VKGRSKHRNLRRKGMRRHKIFKQKEQQRRKRKKKKNLTKPLLSLRQKRRQHQK